VLDHLFVEAIGSVRQSLDGALLSRHALEEQFQVDVILGDVTWETAYTLPGEDLPPRVVAEVTLEWPTWSQSIYRSWTIGEPPDEPPSINVDMVLRVQRLSVRPDPGAVLDVLPEAGPALGDDELERSSPVIEEAFDHDGSAEFALEVSYGGVYEIPEEILREPGRVARELAVVGPWVASTLVRLADVELAFLPPDPSEPANPG
jgi:hypothetical protein